MNISTVIAWLKNEGFTFGLCHPIHGCCSGGKIEDRARLAAEIACQITSETGDIVEIKSTRTYMS